MDKERLQQLLDALHQELDRADTLADESRAALRQSARDIQVRIERTEKTDEDDSLLDRLKAAVVQFEGTHPTLALAITQVVNGLVDIGI